MMARKFESRREKYKIGVVVGLFAARPGLEVGHRLVVWHERPPGVSFRDRLADLLDLPGIRLDKRFDRLGREE